MKENIFAVVGGDERNLYICDILRRGCNIVKTYGLCEKDESSLKNALANCNFIIGGTPFSRDGVRLNAPYSDEDILIDNFLQETVKTEYKKLFAGAVTEKSRAKLEGFNVRYVDFLSKKEAAIRNAIPTAEGAVALAVQNTNITIHGNNALIIGYGNIGKILAKYLHTLGANTFVAARRAESLAEIESHSHGAVDLRNVSEFGEALRQADFIFNTVPFRVIDRELIDKIRLDALYMELASSPYGMDIEAGALRGLKILNAPSLPGKIAPKTAAQYIIKIIYGVIQEG